MIVASLAMEIDVLKFGKAVVVPKDDGRPKVDMRYVILSQLLAEPVRKIRYSFLGIPVIKKPSSPLKIDFVIICNS